MAKTEEEYFVHLDGLGEAVVRANLAKGIYAGQNLRYVAAWLKIKDQEREERKEASNSKSLALAREANELARKANTNAKIANAIAALAAVAAIIALFFG